MKVIRGLLLGPEPRHIRDLAVQYSLSPAGVSDIIRRLIKVGVLTEVRRGNKRCFSLNLSEQEHECLKEYFLIFDNTLLEKRAKRFSRNAQAKLIWMDEAYPFYRGVKRSNNDAS